MVNKLPIKKLSRIVLLGTVLTGATWYGSSYAWEWWTVGRFQEVTDNAFVRADVTLVAPKVAGYVAGVEVEDNAQVAAGDVLFRIEDADYRARVEQARAEVALRQAALDGIGNQQQLQQSLIAQAEADARSADAENVRAGADFDRYVELAAKNAASVQRLDAARADAAKAASAVAASRARITAERNRVEVLTSDRAGALAALEQARAALKLAEIDLANTVVRAPIDGVVGNRQVRVGRYVQPGTQLLAVVPLSDAYVVANFKETQLDHMRVDQTVQIEVDSFPGRSIVGRVESLSPASGAQFALLPPDNATGNFTKVVQRIPVKITLDRSGPLAGELRPGMSVIAKVDVREDGVPSAPGVAGSAGGRRSAEVAEQ
jgi:membrane fusion protein (multidrug efflux system)